MSSIYRKSKFNKTVYSISDVVNGKAIVVKISVNRSNVAEVVDTRIVEAENETEVKRIIDGGQFLKHQKYDATELVVENNKKDVYKQ